MSSTNTFKKRDVNNWEGFCVIPRRHVLQILGRDFCAGSWPLRVPEAEELLMQKRVQACTSFVPDRWNANVCKQCRLLEKDHVATVKVLSEPVYSIAMAKIVPPVGVGVLASAFEVSYNSSDA